MKQVRQAILLVTLVCSLFTSSLPAFANEEEEKFRVAHTSDWKTFFNLLKNGDASGRLVSNRRVGDQALTGRVREDINYTGEETVTINVDEETGLAIARGNYQYVPNAANVSKYFVQYINQLRQLNGIDKPVSENESVTQFAQAHVDKMLATMKANNNLATFHTNEDIVNGQKVTLYNLWKGSEQYTPNGLVSYVSTQDFVYTPDKEYVYSDQELAYHAMLYLFSNYSGRTKDWNAPRVGLVDETYVYRYGLLFMDSPYAGVGVGIDHKGNYRTTHVFMGEVEGINRDGVFYNQSRYYNPNQKGAIDFDGNGRMLYQGQQVKFLPHVTFRYVYTPSPTTGAPVVNMYRLHDAKTRQHFYTSNANEINLLQSRGWRLEGTAWKNSTDPNGAPVYRMWNTKTGERIFTRHQAEVDKFVSYGWKNEGIAFRMPSRGRPIYRLRNNVTGRYLLTVHQTEIDRLVASKQWKNEGTAFYSVP